MRNNKIIQWIRQRLKELLEKKLQKLKRRKDADKKKLNVKIKKDFRN